MRIVICLFILSISCSVKGQESAFIAEDSTLNMIHHLKEVIVTAEKRELAPIDVPTALSVMTEKNLPLENTLDLRSLSGIAPNFYMQEGGMKLSTPLYIRGIGTVSGTPPVGLYVDGVPIFDKNAFVFDLYDIRQIEILRGPQTTLYGRNSINGLINIHTNAPSPDFSLQAKIGFSSYNSQNYNLMLNLPIRNILYNKLSFSYDKSDGYFTNLFTGKDANNSESYNFRYQGRVYTNNNWKVTFGANYNHIADGGYAYHAVDSLQKDRYSVNYNAPMFYKRDLLSSYINLKKSFGKTSINWLTSYSYTTDHQKFDSDFTYHDVFDNRKKSKQNLVTQEINLQSENTKRVDWTVGLFGFYKKLNNNFIATFGEERNLLMPIDLNDAYYMNNTITKGIAGYGQITLKELLPGLSVTAGLRYDYEHVRLRYIDSLQYNNIPGYMKLHDEKEGQSYMEWLPKFSIMKKWNSLLSSYISISKGYKAGGYNVVSNEMSSRLINMDYDKEHLWNYELGLKYFSSNKKFNLNAAAFYIQWKNQQIFVMKMMGPNIENAGDARSFGGEADLTWEFIPHLSYSFSAGYSNSSYYRHDTKAYEGNRIVMAPDFTLNTGFSWYYPLKTNWLNGLNAATSVTGFGTQYFDEANQLKQNPYFLWNMNLGFSGKYFDVNLWGKNILNKAFFTYMFTSPVGNKLPEYYKSGQSGAPSRFGASISIKI